MSPVSHPELRAVDDGVVISVHVQPGARTTGIAGRHGQSLKVRVAAPPHDGRANLAVVELIARTFGARTAQVRIVAGASSRAKQVLVTEVALPAAARIIDALLE